MRKILFCVILAFVPLCSFAQAETQATPQTTSKTAPNSTLPLSLTPYNLPLSKVDSLMSELTLHEKAELVVGNGWGSMFAAFHLAPEKGHPVPGAAGETRAIPRLGIPSIILSDGPSGVRYKGFSTAFPSPLLMASSFDTTLVSQLGRLMAWDARTKGVDVMLGPGMNIQRSPLCGRGYEYFSEDPKLSGEMAAAMVRGLQAGGVGACVKHFAANNQETNRMQVSAEIDSAALRNIYLENFRLALEAEPWAVMSAYNSLNGVPCQENEWLLTEVLRHEWGYDGVVLTDWWFPKHSPKKVAAGNDLLMPGGRVAVSAIVRAVRQGRLSEDRLNEAARRVLTLVTKTITYRQEPRPICTKNTLLREATGRCMVLLENRNNTLPLTPYLLPLRVSLFGCASYELIISGTGSGYVQVAAAPNVVDGLNEAGMIVDAEPMSFYATYMQKRRNRLHQGGFGPISRYTGKSAFREPEIPEDIIASEAKKADVAVLTICRQAGEAVDRSLEDDWFLTAAEKRNIALLSEHFHREGKRLVVILNICGPVETASWKHLADAILCCWLPGQEGGLALGDVLSGKTAPQGKLPVTFSNDYFEHPTSENFPLSKKDKQKATRYTEGEQVGHFFYDATSVAPSYPFGYGLTF